MIIIECEQNSPEWYAARRGIATASKFDKIITPGGDKSKQWEAYAHEILAEEIVGHEIEGYRSDDMIEGQRREEESVDYYELKMATDTKKVGFILNDERTLGCSPDRLVGDIGLLELKNPKHSTQVGYLLDSKVAKEYWPQIQGQLYITGRLWVDVMAYFPEMPEMIIRCGTDSDYIRLMAEMLADFTDKLAKKRLRLIELGHIKQKAV